ncbi:MAG: hypothetical protein JW822_01370 [Spirochaetales bacterium]|nr:hypothetical protein [Spirochaetales bacterium]
MMHIEFLGLPGSGKSLLSDKLEHYLKEKNNELFLSKKDVRSFFKKSTRPSLLKAFFNAVPNVGIEKILFYTFKNIKHLPLIILEKPLCYILNCSSKKLKGFLKFIGNDNRVIPFLLGSNEYRMMDGSSKILVLRRFFNTTAKYQAVKDHPDNRIMIFHELFYQRVINLFVLINDLALNINKQHVYEYLSAVPKPDLVIVVASKVNTCKRRLDKRGDMPLRIAHKDDTTVNAFLDKCDVCINIIIEWMRKNKVPFIVVDNNGELEHSFKELVDKMSGNELVKII